MQEARTGRCRSWATTALRRLAVNRSGRHLQIGAIRLVGSIGLRLVVGVVVRPVGAVDVGENGIHQSGGCKLAKSLELVVARVDGDARLLGADAENVSGDLLAETLDDIRDVVGFADDQAHVGVGGA